MNGSYMLLGFEILVIREMGLDDSERSVEIAREIIDYYTYEDKLLEAIAAARRRHGSRRLSIVDVIPMYNGGDEHVASGARADLEGSVRGDR